MKNKFKGILVIILTAVIAVCLMKLLDGEKPSNDTDAKAKGSYSYYYTEPSMFTEESNDGIHFYDK